MLTRAGARHRQAGSDHREDGRGPAAQVLRGSRAARAALRHRRRDPGRRSSWPRGEGSSAARCGDRLRPLCLGRGHREASRTRQVAAERPQPRAMEPARRPSDRVVRGQTFSATTESNRPLRTARWPAREQGDHGSRSNLPSRPAQSLRRSADGRAAITASTRPWSIASPSEIRCGPRPGRRALPRDRRRQHLPRPVAARGRDRARLGRLHGHAGDRDERAGDAERAGALRRCNPGAVGDPDAVGLRALYPAARVAPPGEGPGGDLRRGYRQPVLHDRHRGGAARLEMGCDALLKATQVDGVYDADPKRSPTPSASSGSPTRRCCRATCRSWMRRRSRLARENAIPILVFSIQNGASPQGLRRRDDYTIIAD